MAPISQQDHNALLLGPVPQAFRCKAHGIANCRCPAGHAQAGFQQQGSYGFPVKGQGCLHVGLGAEQDQPQAVTLTAVDKLVQHPLDRLQSVDAAALNNHVALIHTGRYIHQQHQVTAADRHLHLLAHMLGPGDGEHQAQPGQKKQQLAPARCPAPPGADAGHARQPVANRDDRCIYRFTLAITFAGQEQQRQQGQ